MNVNIHHGDCRDILPTLHEASIDACVTDPPYEIGFMGREWDRAGIAYDAAVWSGVLRVLKPGAHLLTFGGTRTFHRLTCAIEDAGFEIRDCIMWVYGSGFPKSKNLAGEWKGWGSALKPAWEPIIVARKPLDGTLQASMDAGKCGALNIDGCRVETSDNLNGGAYSENRKPSQSEWVKHGGTIHSSTGQEFVQPAGRWPANLIHDGSDEVVALFPGEADSAARFFYCPKINRKDRNEGCEGMPRQLPKAANGAENAVSANRGSRSGPRENCHPTVKPTDLMRYLCRLVTPPGGVVLDPFTGSGSTGRGALSEGFRFIGIEREAEYVEIARARIRAVSGFKDLT